MKKTLLSILAGLMVIGSAVAAPTPDDRRALCEKHPDKYVWVEKDKFCAPLNPCKSDNYDVKRAYCIDDIRLPREQDKAELVVDKYLEKVLGTKRMQYHESGRQWQYLDGEYLSVMTVDGGYMVFPIDESPAYYSVQRLSGIWLGFAANGHKYEISMLKHRSDYFEHEYVCGFVENERQCKDVADFVSLINADGDVLEFGYRDDGYPDSYFDSEPSLSVNCCIQIRSKEIPE